MLPRNANPNNLRDTAGISNISLLSLQISENALVNKVKVDGHASNETPKMCCKYSNSVN